MGSDHRAIIDSWHLGWLPRRLSGKQSTYQCSRRKRLRFDPWVRKIPWRRKWLPTPVFLPGKPCGQRSLVGCSPWGHKRVRHTKWLTHTINVGWMNVSLTIASDIPLAHGNICYFLSLWFPTSEHSNMEWKHKEAPKHVEVQPCLFFDLPKFYKLLFLFRIEQRYIFLL